MPTLSGLSVVEVRCGTGALGAAITTALPAALLANAGAEVTVIQTDGYDDTFDEVSGSPKCWDHSKRVEAGRWSSPGFRREAHSAVAAADVVLFAGARSGRVFQELANDGDAPDGWVVVDCQASDWEIIVQARCGLTSLVAGEHLEPTYTAVPMAGYGTALTVYCAALSILYVKDGPARPQLCFSTTMAEGLVATQAMLLRTVEKPRIPLGPISTQRWQYQCADGTWVHLNLVPAGAQQGFRDVLAELGADGRAQGLDFSGGDDDPLVRTLLGCTDSVTLLGLLSRHAVPGQPVLSPARAFADLDFARNDLVHPRQGSPGSIGRASRVESADGTAVRGASRWSEGSLPLTGITVVDAGAYVAGPFGASVLAQFGARVIKVEAARGDPLRTMPDIFAVCNPGKESVIVDFGDPASAELLRGLIEAADVVQHNIRPATAAHLGFDEKSCRAASPGLVYSRLSAFGAVGVRATEPGFDQTFQAVSGVELAFGGIERPLWHPSAMCDIGAGWLAAAGVIEGLIHRKRTGLGVSVNTAAVAGGLLAVSGLTGSREGAQELSPLRGIASSYRLYGCLDGRSVAVVVPRDSTFAQPDRLDQLTRHAAGSPADSLVRLVQAGGGLAVVAPGTPLASPFGGHPAAYQAIHREVLTGMSRMAYHDHELGHVDVALLPGSWSGPAGPCVAVLSGPPRLGQH